MVQTVGRIIRQENENFALVVDLVDKNFGSFKGMYYKRRRYYNSKGYEIIGMENVQELSNEIIPGVIPDKCFIIDDEE